MLVAYFACVVNCCSVCAFVFFVMFEFDLLLGLRCDLLLLGWLLLLLFVTSLTVEMFGVC